MKKLMDNKARVQDKFETPKILSKDQADDRDLESLLEPIHKLDAANVDKRVLNLLRVTLCKEFYPRTEIPVD